MMYKVTVSPKEGRAHNPLHDEINGRECCNLKFEVGERGRFSVKIGDDISAYRGVSTSTIVSVVDNDDKSIDVETFNTHYHFEPIGF